VRFDNPRRAVRRRNAAPAVDSKQRQEHGRKAQTQARILEAALALFSKRGFDRTSVASIASRAGVSHATVFWHFGNKQGLFEQVCREMLRPFLEQIAKSLAHTDARTRLFNLFGVYEDFVDENRETIQTIVRWVLESPSLRVSLGQSLLSLHDNFAHDVHETLERLIDDSDQAAAVAAGLVSLLDGNLILSLFDPQGRSEEVRRAGLRTLAELALGDAAELVLVSRMNGAAACLE